ncbi:MAG: hypothetical protein K5929_09340 [Lachnospiraceae bacterium]|nr:hypothetical protein [Lachnospiraceae bacterium]
MATVGHRKASCLEVDNRVVIEQESACSMKDDEPDSDHNLNPAAAGHRRWN